VCVHPNWVLVFHYTKNAALWRVVVDCRNDFLSPMTSVSVPYGLTLTSLSACRTFAFGLSEMVVRIHSSNLSLLKHKYKTSRGAVWGFPCAVMEGNCSH
jgi:hypothetical protein